MKGALVLVVGFALLGYIHADLEWRLPLAVVIQYPVEALGWAFDFWSCSRDWSRNRGIVLALFSE